MHQPAAETMFRRGSFGVEPSLKDVPPSSEAAQQFTDMLNRPDRPIPSRRSSMRAGTTTFVPPPPPPPPIVDPIRVASQTTPMRPPSPIDMPRSSSNIRKAQRSPVRPPPLMSSPPRRNSSQAEHFMRSSISPPPSASKRAYSFAREQSFRPSVVGQPRPPTRTNSCPPDADIFKTRMMRSNSDGYTSASTSFVTEGSSSPTSSDSSQPSDNEEGLHIKMKANYTSFDPAQLEMESRRLELVWRETEKQWKDKRGIGLPRSQDMAFRRNVEAGLGQKDDSPQEQEWREMWKNHNSSWAEFEVRWRKEESQRRARNDDNHFYTPHAESRGVPVADDDKVMSTILSHFEKEMEKRRQRAERKRLEEAERKRLEEAERKREHEPPVWQATAERESESRRPPSQGTAKEHATDWPHDNWLHDKILRPDMMRTRSSRVVVEARPAFQRSRSGSVATIVDPLASDTVPNPLPFNPVSDTRRLTWNQIQIQARHAIKAQQDRLDRLLAADLENLGLAEEALALHRARRTGDDPEYRIRLLAEEELRVQRERERVAKLRVDNAQKLTQLIEQEVGRIRAAMIEDERRGLFTSDESDRLKRALHGQVVEEIPPAAIPDSDPSSAKSTTSKGDRADLNPTAKSSARYLKPQGDVANFKTRKVAAPREVSEERKPGNEEKRKSEEERRNNEERTMLVAWEGYEKGWQDLLNGVNESGRQLTFYDIPWPVLVPARSFEELNSGAIENFLLSPYHSTTKTHKMRLRAALMQWHPDKFAQRFEDRLEPSHQPAILAAVKQVRRILAALVT